MKYIVTINGKDYEVEVEKGSAEVKSISSAAQVTPAPAATAQAAAPTQNAAPTPAPAYASPVSASGEILPAPMPGVILEIKKNAGETVKKGEVVVILEAMKMENEIAAPKDGVVSQIITTKGASVNTGDPLAVIG